MNIHHHHHRHNHLLLRLSTPLLLLLLLLHLTSAVDFLFNAFHPSDLSLHGIATIDSNTLTLANGINYPDARALYPSKITTKNPNSSLILPFSTSFTFASFPISKITPRDGVVFCFLPDRPTQSGPNSGQSLGLINFTRDGNVTNHVFGVEFDTYKDQVFRDINNNHVGIDVNSLVSINAYEAGYWPDNGTGFRRLAINNGRTYQVWIDYVDGVANVTMAPVGMKRPNKPLLTVPLNLSDVLLDEMYVGFASAGEAAIGSYKIFGWSFSNTNFSLSEGLITSGLPNFELPETKRLFYRTKGFKAGFIVGVLILVIVAFLLIIRNKRIGKKREKMEQWELEYWPHRITYQEIESATNNFSEENVIGIGGNGNVYKGVFPGGSEIAVKRISRENSEGVKAFSAEISSLGRLKHRNLVGLRGWCKKDKGSLILVYDYMENGSLDKRVFECEEIQMIDFQDRIRILKQVACGIMYLHHGWESKVLHRDIKASNVLLDKDMNARLGDFGLARMHDLDRDGGTTRLVGTVGYLAPEVVRSGRASTQTDVFSYGVLVLEVICGRRPIEQGKPLLLEWLLELFRRGDLISGVDQRLRANGDFDEEEFEKMLHLGLICAHPDSKVRPTMRQVVKLFEEKTEIDEPEGEGEEMYILEKIKNKEFLCSFGSLTWSNSIAVGR